MEEEFIASDLPLNLDVRGLADGARAYSRAQSNFKWHFRKIHIVVKFTTGSTVSSSGTITLLVRGSANGNDYEGENCSLTQRTYSVTGANQNYIIGYWVVDQVPAYWILEFVNRTGGTLASTVTTVSSYSGFKTSIVDRYDYFHRSVGRLTWQGDASEYRFPLVISMEGGFAVNGQLPLVFLAEGRLRWTGVATVDTPFPQFANGRVFLFAGAAGGPSASP
jgi:hypothetical protein